MGHLCFICFF